MFPFDKFNHQTVFSKTKMRTSALFNFIAILVYLSQIAFTTAQPFLYCDNCNNTNGNYTINSTYSKNLNTLLSLMSSNTHINNGFYNFSFGQDPDTVYGIALCRADHSPTDCRSNLNDAVKMLPYTCPVQKEAIGYYYEFLMLRYSNRPIFKILENSPNCTRTQATQNLPAPDLRKLKQSVGNFLEGLKIKASEGNSSYKFSSDVEQFKDLPKIKKVYGLAQCNPDLSSSECSDCLEGVKSELEQCCSTMHGAGIYGPVCSIEFGNYPLVSAVANSSLQPILPPTPAGSDGRTKSGKKRGSAYRTWITVISVVSFLLMATLFSVLLRRKMRKKLQQEEGNDQITLEDSLKLDFRTIQLATENFSDANRLGDDKAIAMYKGVLLDGQEIAVKKLHKGGRDSELEFDNEVLLSANLQHKNLVKLLDFCIEKDLQFLVYEFLPNGSLHGFLNDPVMRASLDWQTRYHIISGLARGLLYLHEDSQVRVIHRDLKPSNILLGVQMDAKISNFRTASVVQADQTSGNTRVVGTYGYMPPEYVQHGHSSIKSDVFSYGAILLEIITGQRINEFSDSEKEESLLTYVWRKWSDGTALDVVDKALPNIERQVYQIKRCIKIALLCIQEDPRHRPTMSTVVLMLKSTTVDIAEPIRPAPLILNNMDLQSDCHTNTTQTDNSQETSLNEVSSSYFEPR